MLTRAHMAPKTRRKFVSCWDELDYLCKKIRYWLYLEKRSDIARRYLGRLDRTLKALPKNSIAILREEGLALLYELRGEAAKAVKHRRREIDLMQQLHQEARSASRGTAAYMLRDRNLPDLEDRRAILKAPSETEPSNSFASRGPASKNSMKFAICNETFLDWPFDQAFAFARECGYTGIEIAPFTIATDANDISAAQRTRCAARPRRPACEVVGLHWLLAKTDGLLPHQPRCRRAHARRPHYVRDLARLCRDLGGSIHGVRLAAAAQSAAGRQSHEQGMEYAAEVFQAAMPALEDLDVTLAVEPLGPAEGNFLLTADAGAKLVEMVGSPHCRLHLDCKAMSSEATPIPEIIRRHAP